MTTHSGRAVIASYLASAPEQGDWSGEEHLLGLAEGVINALHQAGFFIMRRTVEPTPHVLPEHFYSPKCPACLEAW